MIEYTVRPSDTLVNIAERFDSSIGEIIERNHQLRGRENRIKVGEIIQFPDVGASSRSDLSARGGMGGPPDPQEIDDLQHLEVAEGQLTFDAEGQDSGRYFSRRLHVSSDSSGVTIGRGYDMKHRSGDEIFNDLIAAEVDHDFADWLRGAAELAGRQARLFIEQSDYSAATITRASQKALFTKTYEELENDVLRICSKADVVRVYGATEWAALDPRVRDVVVDLRFRGDYHPRSRRRVQITLVRNDFTEFKAAISDRDFWPNVPRDRFERRLQYLS